MPRYNELTLRVHHAKRGVRRTENVIGDDIACSFKYLACGELSQVCCLVVQVNANRAG